MAVTPPAPAWRIDVDLAILPCPGEVRAADRVLLQPFAGAVVLVVLDVAGHGRAAAEVADRVERLAPTWPDGEPTVWLGHLNTALRGSQGGVAAVARFDTVAGTLTLASVGNIACTWFSKQNQRFINSDGLLGVVMPTVRSSRVQLEGGGRLLMLSDGVRSAASQILAARMFHSGTAELVRDVVQHHQRRHDDATCVIARATSLAPAEVRA